MPREVVIFDANAYRAVGAQNINAIRTAERAHDIVAQASDRVVIELLAAVGRSLDRPGAQISAVQALTRHCVLSDGRSFIPFAISRFHQAYTAPHPHMRLMASALGTTLLRCFLGDARDFHAVSTDMRRYVRREECRFAIAMVRARTAAWELVSNDHPELLTASRATIAARHFREVGVEISRRTLGLLLSESHDRELTESEALTASAFVADNAPVAVAFLNDLIEQVILGQISPSDAKHANGLWDTHFCMLAHRDARVRETSPFFNGSPVTVVTSDRGIRRAVVSAGHGEIVRSLGAHCRRIGLDALADARRWED